MGTRELDVIIIGAGHAGLSLSYYLAAMNLNHLVLEKNSIGDSWLNQRWDSFKLNTPNKVNLLPGQENHLSDPDGFCTAPEFVSSLKNYAVKFKLPVVEKCEVLSVSRLNGTGSFSVKLNLNGSPESLSSRQIVIASGSQNKKIIPSFAGDISEDIIQLHVSEYKNPTDLPDGSILVIGSAQSGIQVAEDLVRNGKEVYISTSRVGRVPRRYRGKDIVEWLTLTGFFDLKTAEVTDRAIFMMKQPQVSTTGMYGHTISLQSLAREGAVILGKTDSASGISVVIRADAGLNIKFADEFSAMIRNNIDEYIQKSFLRVPPAAEDPDDFPDLNASSAAGITSLNLKENRISTVIWATGFTGEFGNLKLPLFNEEGGLRHIEGISEEKGLYFLGFPWLRKRKSGIILGIKEDAEFIAEKILMHDGGKQ